CAKALSRRRIRLLDEEGETIAVIIQNAFTKFSEEFLEFLARAPLSLLNKTFRACRIVKIENRRLNERVSAASACWVQRFPFEFDRPAINRRGNQRNGAGAARHCGGVVKEFSRDRPLHIFRERNQMQLRATATR